MNTWNTEKVIEILEKELTNLINSLFESFSNNFWENLETNKIHQFDDKYKQKKTTWRFGISIRWKAGTETEESGVKYGIS